MEDPISDPAIPPITFDAEEIARIRAEAGVTGPGPDEPITFPQPIRRKRGRPRSRNADGSFKYPRRNEEDSTDSGPEASSEASPLLAPAPLTKRDEREVASRLVGILTGATGMASAAKPYLQMTDEEAKAIADPLASYLVRNADASPVARQILENYDLLAITFGVMAYVIRVYRDRSNEVVEQQRQSGPAGKTLSRLEQLTTSPDERPQNGPNDFVSTPYG